MLFITTYFTINYNYGITFGNSLTNYKAHVDQAYNNFYQTYPKKQV